jgi:D-alanyl-D-alanine carboxypeptidase (penicillin-binding protein 5/6)
VSLANIVGNLPDMKPRATVAADRLSQIPVPLQTSTSSDLPVLGAESVYAFDRESGTELYQKNAQQSRPIASITKLATVITIVHSHPLDQTVTIPALPTYRSVDSTIGLREGEHYTIKELLAATLVNSANDAADALAIIDSGSVEAFSHKMTDFMKEWGISGAQFSNPSGLVDEGNQASAKAVAQMGALALRNPTLRDLVQTRSTTIQSDEGRTIYLATTDQLLQTGRFTGIKTGYTLAAGECFVGLTKVQGHEIITVVLDSPDRFGETTTLVNWINRNYAWR